MKNQLRKATFLALSISTALITSCSNDDNKNDSGTNLNDLQQVAFANKPDKVISSVKTGTQELNPTTGNNEYVYLTTIEKQTTLSPLSIINEVNLDVIYPGSILRGSSFMNATYDPLVLKNAFKPVVLSMSLRGKIPVTASTLPIPSEVRNVITGLMSNSKNDIDYEAIPTYYEYQSDEITTEDSFKKALDAHLNVNVLGGLVKANFGYTQSSSSTATTSYVMVKVRQRLYSMTIDPKYHTDWIDGNINDNNFGTHEPVYVSNVDYGRVAYILIETTKDETYNSKMVKAAVGVALKVVDIGVDVSYSEEFKKLFAQNKVKVMIVGGPLALGGKVSDYNSFVEFLKTPTSSDLVTSSAPISYKIRRLKDNTEVEVKDMYTTQFKELKAN
ncbi:thiol-activated cytolysin family protein [Flavobacterium sp. KACC 22761]|uniref:thiol-activated cytolysin family protein n=1 Tax=Flavobacterium sp. KACC 22761 TaxID=3092665 RepID=UPI002A750B05|nr:thiol-activated cytolysin family protein [Flavobacterium sp. KACC 22761]WPO80833.1 thiol-activated cytolysin family protein [Flavobacterium sp. KACC 22761]